MRLLYDPLTLQLAMALFFCARRVSAVMALFLTYISSARISRIKEVAMGFNKQSFRYTSLISTNFFI